MRTQVVLASTAYGLATVAAAIDSGLLAGARRRIAVLANTAGVPEATNPIRAIAGFAGLSSRFEAVHDYNAAVEPHHPSLWTPRTGDLPLWERHFRQLWNLGDDDLELVVESIQVSPARTVGRIFADAPIVVYADGLMSYGPTRNRVPENVAHRIERLLHLDLVPGLRPLLLSEFGVPDVLVPTDAFRTVIAEMAGLGQGVGFPDRQRVSRALARDAHRGAWGVVPPDGRGERVALILGQYLAALGLVSDEEEVELYASMVATCATSGHPRVVFKPHPSAPLAHRVRLEQTAAAHGVDLRFATTPELAEAWFARGAVELVVGCFSTALLTARVGYNIPVARFGTELLLDRLTPFQNSNRIPVTIVDAIVPELGTGRATLPDSSSVELLGELVVAVGYAMQPTLLAGRRGEALDFFGQEPRLARRFVKRRRLSKVMPTEAPQPRPRQPVHRRLRRALRRLVRRGIKLLSLG